MLERTACPGVVRIYSMDEVHQSEWDLLVAGSGDLNEVEPHLFVIAFGCLIIGKPNVETMPRFSFGRTKSQRRKAPELLRALPWNSIPRSAIPPELVSLVADDLVPLLKSEHWHDTLLAFRPTENGIGKPSYDVPGVERMLVGTDGAVYAAHFQRPGGKSWFLTLPAKASLVDWVAAAVSH